MNPSDVTVQHIADAMQMHISELLEPSEKSRKAGSGRPK